MSTPAGGKSFVSYLESLSAADYARLAFLQGENGAFEAEGGVYGGTKSRFDNPTAHDTKSFAPRARDEGHLDIGRLVTRWAGSWAFGAHWSQVAKGSWWVLDRAVEQIVDQAAASGDTSEVARQALNVGYTQNGKYKSDMRAVLVCRVTHRVKVLLGVGRPALDAIAGQWLTSRERQLVMLTCDEAGEFHGGEFLDFVCCKSSVDFIPWWRQQDPFRTRRAGLLAAATAKKPAPGGPPIR